MAALVLPGTALAMTVEMQGVPRSKPKPRPAGHLVAWVPEGAALTLFHRPGGKALTRIGDRTEFGSPTALGVVRRRGSWFGVVSTLLPNGRLGWVRRSDVRLTRTQVSVTIDLSARRLLLRRGDRVVHRAVVGIGRPGSTTPIGRFAITDKLPGTRYGSYYGCCILALSAHQPNLPPGWTGGDRVAIHGTNAPSSIGTASSAGCPRAGEADLRVLMRNVPLGAPVTVRA